MYKNRIAQRIGSDLPRLAREVVKELRSPVRSNSDKLMNYPDTDTS